MRRPEFLAFAPRRRLRVEAGALVLTEGRGKPVAREALSAFDAATMQAALARLEGAGPPAPTDIELDSALAQLWMLPYHGALTSEARWRNYAAARFEQALGPADGWSIELASAPPPHDRLGAAVPAWLVPVLQGALGARLRSVRIDALERLGGVVRGERRFTGAVLDVGAAGAWLFFLRRGVLQRVRRRRLAHGDANAVARASAGDLSSEWSALDDGRMPALRAHWFHGDAAPLVDALRRLDLAAQVNACG